VRGASTGILYKSASTLNVCTYYCCNPNRIQEQMLSYEESWQRYYLPLHQQFRSRKDAHTVPVRNSPGCETGTRHRAGTPRAPSEQHCHVRTRSRQRRINTVGSPQFFPLCSLCGRHWLSASLKCKVLSNSPVQIKSKLRESSQQQLILPNTERKTAITSLIII